MKTLEQKFEQAKKLTELLVSNTSIQSDRYYFVLRIFQDLRLKLNEKNRASIITSDPRNCYFDRPELKVTSGTYIRAKKSLEKQINNRFLKR